jgi:hypothetical protein
VVRFGKWLAPRGHGEEKARVGEIDCVGHLT